MAAAAENNILQHRSALLSDVATASCLGLLYAQATLIEVFCWCCDDVIPADSGIKKE